MVMLMGQAFLFTILAPIGREIGLVEYEIGMIMSVHGFFMLFSGPMWGGISESWGRRKVIVLGSLCYATSIFFFGLVVRLSLDGVVSGAVIVILLVASRAVFAIGAGAVTPGALAMAADLSTPQTRLRAISILTAATSTGAIIGPVAAVFAGLGLVVPFYIIASLGLLGVIVAGLILPESSPRDRRLGGAYLSLLKGPALIITLAAICFMSGLYGAFSVIGFHVQDRFGLDTVGSARLMGMGLMAAAATNVFTQGVLIRRIKASPKVLVLLGAPLTILSLVVIWAGGAPAIFIMGMIINGFGQGFCLPALSTALSLTAGPESQGKIAGLSTFAQAMAFFVAPMSGAALYQLVPSAPFMVGSILIMGSLVLMGLLRIQGAHSSRGN